MDSFGHAAGIEAELREQQRQEAEKKRKAEEEEKKAGQANIKPKEAPKLNRRQSEPVAKRGEANKEKPKSKSQSAQRKQGLRGWVSQWFFDTFRDSKTNIEAVLGSPSLIAHASTLKLESDQYDFKIRIVEHDTHRYHIGGYELQCRKNVSETEIARITEIVKKYNNEAYKVLALPTLLVYNENKNVLYATDCTRNYEHVDKYDFSDDSVYEALIKLHSLKTCLTDGMTEFIVLYYKHNNEKYAFFASIDVVEKKPHPFNEANQCLDWISVCYLVSQTKKIPFEDYYHITVRKYLVNTNDMLMKQFIEYKTGAARGNPRKLNEIPVVGKDLRTQYARALSKENEEYPEEDIPGETQVDKINRRMSLCTDPTGGKAAEECVKYCTWTPAKMPYRFRVMLDFNGVLKCFNLQSVFETKATNKYWKVFTPQQQAWITRLYHNMHMSYAKEVVRFFESLSKPLRTFKEAHTLDTEDEDGYRVYRRTILAHENQPDLPAISLNGLGFTTARKYTHPSSTFEQLKLVFSKKDTNAQGSLYFERNKSGNYLFDFVQKIFNGYKILADKETGMQYYMDGSKPTLVPFGIYAALMDAKQKGRERDDVDNGTTRGTTRGTTGGTHDDTRQQLPTHFLQQHAHPTGFQSSQNAMSEREIIEWFRQQFPNHPESYIRQRAQVNGGLQAYYDKYKK